MPTHQDIELAIRRHLEVVWPERDIVSFEWMLGPINKSISDFKVFRIAPSKSSEPWAYVSCGAWQAETQGKDRYEFFLLSSTESPSHVETLAMLANFHAEGGHEVQPAKIIDIGRPWMDGATCDHLLVSLPYPIGPRFEYLHVSNSTIDLRFLWLMPITADEAAFAKNHGIEALEQQFEKIGVDYLNPRRPSVLPLSKAGAAGSGLSS